MTRKWKYDLLICWSEENQAYLAEVLELPGCMADGSTYEDALTNVEGTIQEWMETAKDENRPIPEPKGRSLYA